MPETTIHERRQLNLEIETAFIAAAEACTNIHVLQQTKRGGSLATLYQKFYSAFYLLYVLTRNLKQLGGHEGAVNAVGAWLLEDIDMDDDTVLKKRCVDGDRVFMEYNLLLTRQGIIALPLK